MNPIAYRHLLSIRRNLHQLGGQLVISRPEDVNSPRTQERWVRYLKDKFGQDLSADLASHATDLPHWLARMDHDLFDDLVSHVQQDPQALPLLQQCAVAYVPLVNANACAQEVPGASGCYALGLELSLYWVAYLLVEALMLASVGRDEDAWLRFQRLLHGWQLRRMAPTFDVWLQGGLATADEEMALQSGAVASVIFRFVALHEWAHVRMGHVNALGMGLAGNESGLQRVLYARQAELGQAASHAMEFEADRLAIDLMLSSSNGAEPMWNNMVFIGSLMRFWHWAEQAIHIPDDDRTHPPPLLRLAALEQRVREVMGDPPNDAPDWAADKWEHWCERWSTAAQAPSNQ